MPRRLTNRGWWGLLMLLLSLPMVGLRGDDEATPLELGRITDRNLGEISGLTVSPAGQQVLWVVNDSGNSPRLHGLDRSGALLASVAVTGARNRDWEDLAGFTRDGRGYLVIGEVGDNSARYPYSVLYVVPEPEVPAAQSAMVERVIYFTYPQGPRDAEGIAVDQEAGEVLVLAKRTTPPELYAVPLDAQTARASQAVLARKVGELATIPAPTAFDLAANPVSGIYSSQPTSLDWSPARGLLVMTYARPYLFVRQGNEPLADLISRAPQALGAPRLQQAEAAAFDGDAVLITSEGLPAPLLRLPLRSRR